MREEYIVYKHRGLSEGKKEWTYSFFTDEGRLYRGPYHSIDELAENLSALPEIMDSRLRSRNDMVVETGVQISHVSEDELAEIYFKIKEIKQRRRKILIHT